MPEEIITKDSYVDFTCLTKRGQARSEDGLPCVQAGEHDDGGMVQAGSVVFDKDTQPPSPTPVEFAGLSDIEFFNWCQGAQYSSTEKRFRRGVGWPSSGSSNDWDSPSTVHGDGVRIPIELRAVRPSIDVPTLRSGVNGQVQLGSCPNKATEQRGIKLPAKETLGQPSRQ
ncbi:hypothetical protein M407DRAFT_7273 [Tulasnella calospora MUT 4182]|uniref:Uncharacterized protein n=1 Tax=Tulasnella calospora MUT 4182 TaxID=1051891 RepID=A0A0C3M1B3_9AGAM|nr:hypothetical protein M407DRAFT_7273 [Tulasnella calospora MUT 4182]